MRLPRGFHDSTVLPWRISWGVPCRLHFYGTPLVLPWEIPWKFVEVKCFNGTFHELLVLPWDSRGTSEEERCFHWDWTGSTVLQCGLPWCLRLGLPWSFHAASMILSCGVSVGQAHFFPWGLPWFFRGGSMVPPASTGLSCGASLGLVLRWGGHVYS